MNEELFKLGLATVVMLFFFIQSNRHLKVMRAGHPKEVKTFRAAVVTLSYAIVTIPLVLVWGYLSFKNMGLLVELFMRVAGL